MGIIKGRKFGYSLYLMAGHREVPTELTENTEAYGLKLNESTDRIDATRHTTEGTEMIACNICLHFCGFLPREA